MNEGKDVADGCRQLQVAEQTCYRWCNQFGGMNADDAERLKHLEPENATLNRLPADAELEKPALKEILRKLLAGNGAGGRAPPDEDDEGE
jgi:putative transposase